MRANHGQGAQVTISASIPHARVQRVAGLDYINRGLSENNYKAGHTILVNSHNPADEWRSLKFLNEWTLDGIVMSNDSPGYILSSGTGARNDRLFNVAIQGPTQVNNGYEDEGGRGIAARHDRGIRLAGGRMGTTGPEREINDHQGRNRMVRDSSAMAAIMDNDIKALVAGPFYDQYPLQMFDRNIRPMSELFIGLVCREFSRKNLDGSDNKEGAKFIDSIHESVFEEYVNPIDGKRGKTKNDDAGTPNVDRVHIFQFVPFSSRQAWQYATQSDGEPDRAIVDNSTLARRTGDGVGGTYESEPAYRRRGPNDPKRVRDKEAFIPRKKQDQYWKQDNFIGLKEIELKNMVGAWRLGRVLDVASSRKEGYTGGPIDTAFRVTLNVDLSFLDWRALRRGLGIPWIGGYTFNCPVWVDSNKKGKAPHERVDDERVMQWPTKFNIYTNRGSRPSVDEDENIPIPPKTFDEKAAKLDERIGQERMSYMRNHVHDTGYKLASAAFKEGIEYERVKEMDTTAGYLAHDGRIQASAAGGSDDSASSAVVPPMRERTATHTKPIAAPAAPAAPAPKATDSVPVSVSAPAPKAAPASKSSGKRPATEAVVGEDLMAKIFGSSESSSAPFDSSSTTEPSTERPKSFPRRNRDR